MSMSAWSKIIKSPAEETLELLRKGYENLDINELARLEKLFSMNSNLNWDVAYNEFLKCLKLNKCTKMLMYTELDPKFWEKKYKFKLKKYEMELNLKED